MAEMLFMNDFTGGWNADKSPESLQPNELVVADNIDISNRGGVRKRPGLVAINTSYGAKVTQIFEWVRASGNVYLMAVIGNGLYQVSESGSRTLVQTLKANCESVSFFSFNDKLYFLDGEKIYTYNGSTSSPITQAGTPTISAVPAPEGVEPLAKGLYRIAVTFELSGGAMVGPLAIGTYNLTANDSILKWTNIPSGPIGTVARRLWRTMPGLERFYAIGEVTQQNDFTDSVQIKGAHGPGEPFSASSNFEAINRCRFAVRHPKSLRVFYAGDPSNQNALMFSEPNAPDYVKGTSVMYPSTDEGPITGLALFVDSVMVFFRHCAYIWRGIDPEIDAIWTRIPIADGVRAHRTICHTTNSLTYLGDGGIYTLHPSVLGQNAEVELGTNVVGDITRERISSVIKNIRNPEKCVATFDRKNRRYILAYEDPDIAVSGNNALLVMEEQFGGSCVRWQPIKAHCVYTRLNGEVLIGTDNFICKFGGHTDLGQPIQFVMSGLYAPNTAMTRKLFTKVTVTTRDEALPEKYMLDIGTGEGFTESYVIQHDDSFVIDTVSKRFRTTAKMISVGIRHNEPVDFEVQSIGIEYTPVRAYGRRT